MKPLGGEIIHTRSSQRKFYIRGHFKRVGQNSKVYPAIVHPVPAGLEEARKAPSRECCEPCPVSCHPSSHTREPGTPAASSSRSPARAHQRVPKGFIEVLARSPASLPAQYRNNLCVSETQPPSESNRTAATVPWCSESRDSKCVPARAVVGSPANKGVIVPEREIRSIHAHTHATSW